MSKNHNLLKRKYWIFDLDGTLTIAVHDFNAIREELGIPEGQPIIKTLESIPLKESRKQKKKLQEIEEKLALNASPAPGVKRLLETLSSQNYFIGILTLNTRENAWTTLRALGLSEYFPRGSGKISALSYLQDKGLLSQAHPIAGKACCCSGSWLNGCSCPGIQSTIQSRSPASL